MQGWLNPRGRLPQATYWLRRALVLVGLLVLVLGVSALVRSCAPKPTPSTVPATPQGQQAVVSPTSTPSAEAPTAAPTTAGPATSGAPSAAPTASAGSTPATSPAAHPSATPTASAPITPPTPDVVSACDPEQMRITIEGERYVKSPSTQKLTLGVANATGDACALKLSPELVSITITSGPQTVWSTAHCKTWVPTTSVTLRGQQSHQWSVAWPTRSSGEKCTLSSALLPSGTYVATARIAGGPEASMVMELKR